MAGSTYLVLTNKLLARLNEVQLTSTTFASAGNVHLAAKNCINAALSEIQSREYQWPWNRVEATVNLVIGTHEYDFPEDDAVPDWDSFRIVGDPTEYHTQSLYPITREEFYRYYRQRDYDSGSDGVDKPKYVYPTNKGGFGVTPAQNKTYEIKYEYFTVPSELVNHSDTTTIPSNWDYVIINFALKHFYMYKDNTEQAGMWNTHAEKSFTQLRDRVVNRPDYMWGTVSNFGGQKWSIDYTKV